MMALLTFFDESSVGVTLFILGVCVAAAALWVVYMMQLVANEEEIAERIRAEIRRLEEEQRRKDDKARARKAQQAEFMRQMADQSIKRMNGPDE